MNGTGFGFRLGRGFTMKDIDCYGLLGVDRDASTQVIKKAYRSMVSDYHPDRLMGLNEGLKKLAREELRKINHAKETLLDPDRRRDYDVSLDKTGGSGGKKPIQRDVPVRQRNYTYFCPHCRSPFTAIPTYASYITNCPLCRGTVTIPAVPMERTGVSSPDNHPGSGEEKKIKSDSEMEMDTGDIYEEALSRAMDDGIITGDEMNILEGLQKSLSISRKDHDSLVLKLKREKGSGVKGGKKRKGKKKTNDWDI